MSTEHHVAARVPLLLIDVDGVISLFGFDHGAAPPGRMTSVDGLPHLISEQAGPLLARLKGTFECVWCTGWEDRAPEHLPGLLDIACRWPHLSFSGQAADRHWKLDAIDAHAGSDRPLAWIDDGHDDTCRDWARGRPGPTLLVATAPHVGITADHVDELLAWAAGLEET